MVYPLCPDSGYFSLLVLATSIAVIARPFLMKKQIERVTSQPLWNANLPHDKRVALFVVISSVKPSDINKFEDMSARYTNFPTKIAAAVMGGILNLLYYNIDNEDDRKKMLVAYAVYVLGGLGIGAARHGSLLLDIFFRFIFGIGFIAMMYFLSEVSDIVLIGSIN